MARKNDRWKSMWPLMRSGLALGGGSCSVAFSVVLVLSRNADTALLVLGALVVLFGAYRLARALVKVVDPAYRSRTKVLRLVWQDARLALKTMALGGAVIGATVAGVPPFATAAAGFVLLTRLLMRILAVTADVLKLQGKHGLPGSRAFLARRKRSRRWIARAKRSKHFPGATRFVRMFNRREPPGEMTRHTARMLTAFLCVVLAIGGVATAKLAEWGVERTQDATATTQADDVPFDYAHLCPSLPNPLVIGHGLGELFQRSGAVQAGCGRRAQLVSTDVPVWISEGRCGDELRSLAVSFPGAAVLLYGQAARFAKTRADDGSLRFAERATLGGGEVVIVGTVEGTYVLVRMTPSLRRGSRRKAHRCNEVDEVARPFAVLKPALAVLWLLRVRVHKWTWPLPDPGRGDGAVAFLDPRLGRIVAHGSCDDDGSCSLSDADGVASASGYGAVSIDDLAPYAP